MSARKLGKCPATVSRCYRVNIRQALSAHELNKLRDMGTYSENQEIEKMVDPGSQRINCSLGIASHTKCVCVCVCVVDKSQTFPGSVRLQSVNFFLPTAFHTLAWTKRLPVS